MIPTYHQTANNDDVCQNTNILNILMKSEIFTWTLNKTEFHRRKWKMDFTLTFPDTAVGWEHPAMKMFYAGIEVEGGWGSSCSGGDGADSVCGSNISLQSRAGGFLAERRAGVVPPLLILTQPGNTLQCICNAMQCNAEAPSLVASWLLYSSALLNCTSRQYSVICWTIYMPRYIYAAWCPISVSSQDHKGNPNHWVEGLSL